MTPKQAVGVFLKDVVAELFVSTIEAVLRELLLPREGANAGNDVMIQERERLRNWIQSLSSSEQEKIAKIVCLSVDMTIFSVLNILDGTEGYIHISQEAEPPDYERKADLQLYLRVLEEPHAATPEQKYLLNDAAQYDLHDIYDLFTVKRALERGLEDYIEVIARPDDVSYVRSRSWDDIIHESIPPSQD